MRRRLFSLLIVSSLAAACAPATPIRRSALVNAPALPSRTGLPLAEKEVRITGEINPIRFDSLWFDVGDYVASEGDPGMFLPRIQVGGSIYGSPVEGLEIGAQLRYARLEWSDPNSIGVLDFPDDSRGVFQGGFGMRGNIPLYERLHLSVAGELNLSQAAQAVFVCWACVDGGFGTYEFERYDSALFLLPNLSTGLSYRINDYVGVFSTFGVSLGVKNIGFEGDIKRLEDDSLSTMWMFPVGAGVEANISHFVASATFFYPFELVEGLDFGPSVALKMGARF